jgi:nucleotide-binding universal stress UspA family protein
MIKRILVGLGTSRTADSVTDHALEIARTSGAELLGLAVTDPVRLDWTGPKPMGVGLEATAAELRKQRYDRAAAEIAAARTKFAARCIAEGVPHSVDEEIGDPFEVAVDLVRYHDMCVFGLRGLFEHGVVPEPRDALERLIADGVRPILAVPEEHRPIRRVLVAYSGSLESAKTFKHFVLSGIYPDAVVRIACWNADAAAARRRVELAAGYFRTHGYEVDTDTVKGDPLKELVPYAEAWKADLIVAGNSAKNLLMRRIFGETALKLIRESPLPLYLAQ